MISVEKLEGGIARLVIATEGSVNTLSTATNVEFAKIVDEVTRDPAVTGIIITSSKSDFAVGGNLDELRAAMTPAAVAAIIDPSLKAFRQLELSGKPVVAALNGTALGGGYEIALACHRRIAADRPDAQFGLPEAGLGLMPGAGGTQRLPRLIGIAAAAELILKGKTLGAKDALKAGLVDELVAPEKLTDAAIAWIKANPQASQPWDRKGFVLPGDDPQSVKGRNWEIGQWAKVRSRAAGTDEGAMAILYVLHHGVERALDAGIAIERRHFIRLASAPEAKNRIRNTFFAPKAARPNPPAGAGEQIKTVGVIGGGMMGNGIAFSSARAGLDVVLIDVTEEKAAEAAGRIAKIAERQVSRGRMSEADAKSLVSKIECTADYAKLAKADFVIEAVFERLDVKHDVYRKAEAVLRPDVTIASNTSSIPIAKLAAGLNDPSRMVGMHFFAPVETMKLLEIIVAPGTSEKARGEALAIAKALKKSVIVVKDGLGFFTSRMVSSLSSEAMTLLAEGVAPQVIDNVMVDQGFAIGPATLAELTKLPLLKDIMLSMSSDGMPVSMKGSRAVEALTKLVDAGREGKMAGKGIYDYSEAGPKSWSGLAEIFAPRAPSLAGETVRRRLLYTQSLEAVRALEDGTVDDPVTADLAAVTGWGYPSHLGGPFALIDTIGAQEFAVRADALRAEFGERFAVPGKLRDMAAKGERFHAL
ncbi:MAG: enoyl-CoA hydratase/isomerase family protein [Rhizobiaceae bacterium]|nr:enoyl-CoA hydratase/isomerase family protein [Rhizobiaceae bacterium]